MIGVVTKELKNNRNSLCEKCEHKQIKSGITICGQCGCLIKAKTALLKAKCPVGKW